MRTSDAPIRRRKMISAMTATLISVVCVMIFCANTVSSQNLRRQMRIQRKIDKKTPRPVDNPNKLTPSNSGNEEPGSSDQPESTAPRAAARQGGQSVDGIRQRGLQSFFTQEE